MRDHGLVYGGILILGAVSLIFNKLGVFTGINFFSIVMTIFLVLIIIKSLRKLQFEGIVFPLAFIGIIFDEELGITALTPWTLLFAALLLSIGLSLVFNKHCFHGFYVYNNNNNVKGSSKEEIIEDEYGNIKILTTFKETIKSINIKNFKRADIKCSFGAVKLYFQDADLESQEADINLDLSFGGVELYVPKYWKVVDKTHQIVGGFNEKNLGVNKSDKVINIYGNVSFSGIDIYYI